MKLIYSNKLLLTAIGATFVLLLSSCAAPVTNRITQTSTIDALLAGDYDGFVTGAELLKYGDFGIGTFHRLDGEMILSGGAIYQVRADGKVYRPDLDIEAPFATVCFFQPDRNFSITEPQDFKGTQRHIDKMAPDRNVFLAIRVAGRFATMRVRSVPSQSKPYMPLAEVVKHQSVYNYVDIEGTLIGFRNPPFVKGLNVPGYHFHFISRDAVVGGHVLDFNMDSGQVELDMANRFLLILPEDTSRLEKFDLSTNRTDELKSVEE